MKTYIFLFVITGTLLLNGCAANTPNTRTNAPAANSESANKPANAANAANAANTNAAAPTAAKTVSATTSFAGDWDSEKYNVKGNAYTQLSMRIKQTGENLSGTYSVVDYIGKEAQVEDGNQTPFIGTVKDGIASIKFDANATVPGYEENVKYKESEEGKPSTATLTIAGDGLQWKLEKSSGDAPFEMPQTIKLNKSKPAK